MIRNPSQYIQRGSFTPVIVIDLVLEYEAASPDLIQVANTLNARGRPLTISGIEYKPVPFKVSNLSQSNQVTEVTLTINNIKNIFSSTLKKHTQFIGGRCSVRWVMLELLGSDNSDNSLLDANNPIDPVLQQWEYSVSQFSTFDENSITFSLTNWKDLNPVIPRKNISFKCMYELGDHNCKKTGLTKGETCNKTLAACKAKNNSENFGGHLHEGDL